MNGVDDLPFTLNERWLAAESLRNFDIDAGADPGQREVFGEWYRCRLSSVFQPVVDPLRGVACGYEAFLRSMSKGERPLSPWSLFSANASDERLIAFDRLVRLLHVLNFRGAFADDRPLFLNVHGRLLAAVDAEHGAFFRRALDDLRINPAHVVIETPVAASQQTELLALVLANYRKHGFQVAVNVDSAAQWQIISSRVHPDFVKIDSRSVLGYGGGGVGGLDWLYALRGDARLILTHLETVLRDDRLRPGVLAEGFAYGRPRPRFDDPLITNA